MSDTTSAVRQATSPGLSGYAVILLSLCATVAMLGFALYYSRYGFDFTDEGFYATWLSNPAAYRVYIPVSFFGFVYHPLYQLLHGDLVLLRQANILLTFGGAWLLSVLLMRQLWPQDRQRPFGLLVITAGIATTSLSYFGLWWLVTPSYNSLAFQGMLLTFIGVIQADRRRSWQSVLGWACIGVGGWLVFLAKPSTAALLGPCALLYLLTSGKRDALMMVGAVALAAGLLVVSAFLIDGSIGGFIHRVTESIALLRTLGSGQEFGKVFRLDDLPFSPREYQLMLTLSLVVLAGAYGLWRWCGVRYPLFICASLLVGLTLVCLAWTDWPTIPFSATVLIAMPIACLAFCCLLGRAGLRELGAHLPLALLLVAAPHIYAFGTNGNYWSHGGAVALFWVLGAIVMLAPLLRQRERLNSLLSLVSLIQFLIASLLVQAINAPYRQELSFRAPHVAWDLRGQGTVMLSKGFRDYLAAASKAAQHAGFVEGGGMIDLTGRSPGLLYALKARSLGLPWLPGGYPGSDALAIAALDTESCEAIATAWLLVEPEGPSRLPLETVLQALGAAPETDYVLADSFKSAKQAGGSAEQFTEQLLRPTRSAQAATQACELARQSRPQDAP